jgi:hypothetical protein
MKAFKMRNLNIHGGAIIRDAGTFHGINKGPPIAKHMVCDVLPNQEPDIEGKMKTLAAWK